MKACVKKKKTWFSSCCNNSIIQAQDQVMNVLRICLEKASSGLGWLLQSVKNDDVSRCIKRWLCLIERFRGGHFVGNSIRDKDF